MTLNHDCYRPKALFPRLQQSILLASAIREPVNICWSGVLFVGETSSRLTLIYVNLLDEKRVHRVRRVALEGRANLFYNQSPFQMCFIESTFH